MLTRKPSRIVVFFSFQVTFQLKILTTALFSVIMLGKTLSRQQWIALFFLFVGISIVQHNPKSSNTNTSTDNPALGLIAVIISSLLSGFAGIYVEKILKGTSKSVWLRNIQLASIGIITGTITMYLNDGEKVKQKGFFYGYDWAVYTTISLQALGGLMVAVTVKYADNILKCFATTGAIVLSCAASMFLFDFTLTFKFIFGTCLVISAVYMYTKSPVQTGQLNIQKRESGTINGGSHSKPFKTD